MIKKFWWLSFFQFYIYGNGMPLIGPNPHMIFVEGVPLFIINPNDFFQYFSGDGKSLFHFKKEFIDRHPAIPVKMKINGLRMMTEYKT